MKLNIIIFLILVLFFYTNCQVKDKTDPNISWVLPENESTHSDTITILVNASDDIGIEKVEIYYSSIADSPLVADSVFIGNMILNSEGQYSYEWYTDVENIPNGVYQIYCIAFDLSDNTKSINKRIITLFNTIEITFINDTYEDVIFDFANSYFQLITAQENKILKIEKDFGIANFNGILNSYGENINLNFELLIESTDFEKYIEINSDYFYLKVINNLSNDIMYTAVNYQYADDNCNFEKVYNLNIPKDGLTYNLGYYYALFENQPCGPSNIVFYLDNGEEIIINDISGSFTNENNQLVEILAN